jgi:predicted RNA-binding Zn-ribbon protein involved in translation (DUF1610 family)
MEKKRIKDDSAKSQCPECGAIDWDLLSKGERKLKFICNNCGHKWNDTRLMKQSQGHKK